MTHSAKLFAEHKGMPVHFEVQAEDWQHLTGEVAELLAWMELNEFIGHQGFGQGKAPAQPRRQPQTGGGGGAGEVPFEDKPSPGPVPSCNWCGGKVWDNRESKRSDKAPDFKCRDQECGGAAWIQKDGSLKWVGGGL